MENSTAAIDLAIINTTSVFEENEGEYWTLMGGSIFLTLMGFFWLLSTVGGIGTIKDLLCGLACSAACEGWKNVDYITESVTFFSYWTCLPWITFTYCLLTLINGILGICAVRFEHVPSLKAFMIFTVVSLIVGILLFWFYACISVAYSCCRCCCEKIIEEIKEMDEMESQPVNNNPTEGEKGKTEEPVEHNYCCNFFLHFAVPMILYFICLCIILSVGWSFAF